MTRAILAFLLLAGLGVGCDDSPTRYFICRCRPTSSTDCADRVMGVRGSGWSTCPDGTSAELVVDTATSRDGGVR